MNPQPGLIDSHCHLDAIEFELHRDQVVAAALVAGIDQLLVPAVSTATWPACQAMRTRYGCLLAYGLHPLYYRQHLDDHLASLEQLLQTDRPVAIGEIGLDGWHEDSDMARQEVLLAEQLKLAARYGLPVILHVRRAQDRVLKYLRQHKVAGGIVHAFNGSQQQAEAFIKLGFKLGFGGAMTYAGSQRIRRLCASLPDHALVLETDAPDMRPAWAQEQPNQPANLRTFAEEMARLRQIPLTHIIAITRANTLAALGLDADTVGRLHLPNASHFTAPAVPADKIEKWIDQASKQSK